MASDIKNVGLGGSPLQKLGRSWVSRKLSNIPLSPSEAAEALAKSSESLKEFLTSHFSTGRKRALDTDDVDKLDREATCSSETTFDSDSSRSRPLKRMKFQERKTRSVPAIPSKNISTTNQQILQTTDESKLKKRPRSPLRKIGDIRSLEDRTAALCMCTECQDDAAGSRNYKSVRLNNYSSSKSKETNVVESVSPRSLKKPVMRDVGVSTDFTSLADLVSARQKEAICTRSTGTRVITKEDYYQDKRLREERLCRILSITPEQLKELCTKSIDDNKSQQGYINVVPGGSPHAAFNFGPSQAQSITTTTNTKDDVNIVQNSPHPIFNFENPTPQVTTFTFGPFPPPNVSTDTISVTSSPTSILSSSNTSTQVVQSSQQDTNTNAIISNSGPATSTVTTFLTSVEHTLSNQRMSLSPSPTNATQDCQPNQQQVSSFSTPFASVVNSVLSTSQQQQPSTKTGGFQFKGAGMTGFGSNPISVPQSFSYQFTPDRQPQQMANSGGFNFNVQAHQFGQESSAGSSLQLSTQVQQQQPSGLTPSQAMFNIGSSSSSSSPRSSQLKKRRRR